MVFDLFWVEQSAVCRDEISGQILLAGSFFVGQHKNFLNVRLLSDGCFDLAQFDPKPPDFHLMVQPAEKLDVAVGKVPGQIASFIQSLPFVLWIWRLCMKRQVHRDKAFSGQGWLMEIAPCQPTSSQIEFARDADGHWFSVWVKKIDLGIGDGPADGGGRATVGGDDQRRRHDARFGGSIIVDQVEGQGLAWCLV